MKCDKCSKPIGREEAWFQCELCRDIVCESCVDEHIIRETRGPDDYRDVCVECKEGNTI